MDRLKKHISAIVDGIITNIIWIPLISLISSILSLAASIYNNKKMEMSALNFYNILIAIIIVLLILLLFVLYKYKTKHADENTWVKFKAKNIEAELYFDTRTNITSTLTYDLVVLSEGEEEIKRSVIWTGSDYLETKLTQMDGDYTLIDANRKQSPYDYIINFGRVKMRGETIHFQTKTDVRDDNESMSPVYSFMIKYQIDTLKLKVVAPKNLIHKVTKASYVDRLRDIALEPQMPLRGETIGNNLICYSYTFNNPTLFHNYFIEWEFTK